MNELVIIVEGETEQTFVRQQLAPHLIRFNTIAWAVLSGRRRNQGGVRSWDGARQDIIRILREGRFCSTMFDYYALPQSWPGRVKASAVPLPARASTVETEVHSTICGLMGSSFNPKFFIPYIQLHEFEALAFASVAHLVEVLSPLADHPERLLRQFSQIVEEAGTPEAIDDGAETSPSHRITSRVPAYQKRAQGPIVTDRIGLDVLRQQCVHFGTWLSQLECLDSA